MALRLSKAFQTDAEMWLNMQKDYDLWHAEQKADDLLKEVVVVP
jgi:addiction module HigA family antidote